MKIISVVGARPNFIKVAPLHKALNKYKIINPEKTIQHIICHTGQHYDTKMSDIFFEQLELPAPDYYLNASSGSHAEQTAHVMVEFEKVLLIEKPDLVIVVGDVNSTLACSITASKLNIKIAHIESGLRSFDRFMPEEINRVLTDVISDYLFVTEKSGLENLKKEGIPDEKVFFVGNVMIDSLLNYLSKVDKSEILDKYGLKKNNYILVTMHRPSNVDYPDKLNALINILNKLAAKKRVIFPVHPRTLKNIEKWCVLNGINPNLILTDPIGYLDFISLIKNAEVILTDSGGIQEESTFLGTQCITIRNSTERPITIEIGTNQLVGDDLIRAEHTAIDVLAGKRKTGSIPDLWDGKTAERIIKVLMQNYN